MNQTIDPSRSEQPKKFKAPKLWINKGIKDKILKWGSDESNNFTELKIKKWKSKDKKKARKSSITKKSLETINVENSQMWKLTPSSSFMT